MLNRIKIRGKLLLLLAAPLLAVLFFAWSGVMDRTDIVDARAQNAHLAEFAQANADLSVTFQIERFQTLLSHRLALPGDELRPDQIATNEQTIEWLAAVDQSLGSVRSAELVDQVIAIRAGVTAVITDDRTDRYHPVDLATELNNISAALQTLNSKLVSEAGDLQLFRALDLNAEVGGIQESLAEIAFIGSNAIFEGELAASGASDIASATSSIGNQIRSIRETADPQYVAILNQLQDAGSLPSYGGGAVVRPGPWVPADALLAAINSGAGVGSLNWASDTEERFLAVSSLSSAVLSDASLAATIASAAATEDARSFLILTSSVVVFALLMALMVGRSVSRPLTQLTKSAEQLSAEELPAMVESLRTASRNQSPTITPITAKGRDEIASLSRAFSEIQTVTAKVAEEQGQLLRRGISDIFVNLARRNQSLLDRQIDFIDQLESREENPDALENLFGLDHLATRMRRNAESLLVLAGTEPARRRGQPVELSDIVRVAMGEIEDFGRIQLVSIDPATVAASVAVDLAHLMSELMENATHFSPPDTSVEVVGRRSSDGTYQITLTDRGIGMSVEQLLNANKTLEEPPIIGLDLSRSLGFTVVSRLAHRRGVGVRLNNAANGGVTAVVIVPAEIVGNPSELEPARTPATVANTPRPAEAVSAFDMLPASSALTPAGPSGVPSLDLAPPARTPSSSGVVAALPMRKPRPQAATTVPPAPPVAPPESQPSVDVFESFSPAAVPAPTAKPNADLFATLNAAIPVTPDELRCVTGVGAAGQQITGAGLTRRTPKQIDVTGTSRYSTGPGTRAQAPSPVTRSPEEVRQMLTRYRAGLRKGRTPEPGDANADRHS